MKKIHSFLVFLCATSLFAQQQTGVFTTDPVSFNATDQIVITVDGVDPAIWNVSDIYLWTWYYDLNDVFVGDSPTNGIWTDSDESQKFTDNGDGTFSYTMIPSDLFGTDQIGRIGMLAKADDASDMGSGERKTQDFLVEVGAFQTGLIAPQTSTTVVDAGDILTVSATSSTDSDFELFDDGVSIDLQQGIMDYTFNYTITEDSSFELVISDTNSSAQQSYTFSAIVAPEVEEASVPSGMQDGINYNASNPDEATLVLYAPEKTFVHLIGNFDSNDWTIDDTYLLKRDSAQDRFWITLENLDAGDQNLLYQYVVDRTVRIADPYSRVILSPFDDGEIDATTFPDLPAYPTGQTTEAVTWFQLDEEEYQWQTTNFERPAQEDLVIYELLIRDFDELHSFDAVKARLDYLEDLGINAIELMPVNEFDGNQSWGYNPNYHMALDKYYGTRNAFKSFVDECHSRGIAVILDVVYNHGTGQNPYFRLWNDCEGCYTGAVSPENPFFNVEDPNTSFSFFNDFDHESAATADYVDRLNQYWLEEYQIDGYRFDFTKGFTNTVGDGSSFDASRIAILTRMYDEIRAIDPTAYVILEHFAPNNEETLLIEHRTTTNSSEPGMMVWSNHNFNYNEGTMGYNSNSDFSWISYLNRGWTTPSNVGYMESHDEERLNYKNQEFGNSSGGYDVQDLDTALDRLEMAGAFYFTIPGPKMIWQFGELGYDFSINRCPNGIISESCRTDPKPIAWNEGYDSDPDRVDVLETWTRLIELKNTQNVFATDNFTLNVANTNGFKQIQLEDETAGGNDIRFVNIIGNFSVEEITINPDFQQAGTWYDLLNNNENIEISNPTEPITLAPGEFYVYGDQAATLSTEVNTLETISLFPNPTNNQFEINASFDTIEIFDITGKRVLEIQEYSKGDHVSIENFTQGVYLVKTLINGIIWNSKLVKE